MGTWCPAPRKNATFAERKATIRQLLIRQSQRSAGTDGPTTASLAAGARRLHGAGPFAGHESLQLHRPPGAGGGGTGDPPVALSRSGPRGCRRQGDVRTSGLGVPGLLHAHRAAFRRAGPTFSALETDRGGRARLEPGHRRRRAGHDVHRVVHDPLLRGRGRRGLRSPGAGHPLRLLPRGEAGQDSFLVLRGDAGGRRAGLRLGRQHGKTRPRP